MTQPAFSLADAIEERVYVQTPVDTDRDGRLDRVAIDISRPRETATQGFKVPVIFEHSPYRKGTWGDVPYPSVLVDELPQNGSTSRSGLRRRLTWRPSVRWRRPTCPARWTTTTCRAATRWCSARASAPADSDGCPTSGDQAETLGTKAVIDWLNGRAPGFDASGAPVAAGWTTGDGRHDRRLLQRHAAQPGGHDRRRGTEDHRAGLRDQQLVRLLPGQRSGRRARARSRARTPTSWPSTPPARPARPRALRRRDRRDHRGAGPGHRRLLAVLAATATTSTPARWRRASSSCTASTTGTCKTEHFAGWWDELAKRDVPRKIWLHQGGHGGPGSNASVTLPDGRTWTYKQTENRWFDFWLWNVRQRHHGRADRGRCSGRTGCTPRTPTGPTRAPMRSRCGWPRPTPTDPGTLTSGQPPTVKVEQSFVDEGRTIHPDTLVAQPGHGQPEPTRLPLPRADPERPHLRTSGDAAADGDRQQTGREPDRVPGRLRPGRLDGRSVSW